MVRTANTEKYAKIMNLINKGYKHSEIVEELECSYSTIQSAIKQNNAKPIKKTPISESVRRTLLQEVNKLLAFAPNNRLHKIGANILNQLKILKLI